MIWLRWSLCLSAAVFIGLIYSAIGAVRKMRVPGELVLGGLFPIHEAGRNATHQCGKIKVDQGVQRMIAMLFAIEEVNRKRIVQTSLGATILDTCSVDSYALEQSLEFIKSVMHTDAPLCADGNPAETTREPIVAVVGAAGSQVSVMVASMLQLFKIPQVSYSSTGSELSEKPRFAYFSRVVPPDNLQAKVMAEVIKRLEWNYVHAIADTGSYGERGMDSFRSHATDKGICIDGDVHKISRRWTEKNFREMLLRMHNTRKARGVVTFVDEDNLKRLLHVLDMLIQEGHTELHNHFWFVASDSWGIKSSVVKGLEHVTYAAITIAPHVRTQKGYMQFIDRLKPFGPFLEEFWEHLNCSHESDITFGDCLKRKQVTLKQESYVPFVVDTVNIIAKAIKTYIDEDCGDIEFQKCHLSKAGFNGERLQRYYRNVSLNPGEPPLIDANGDGLGRYDVFQLDKAGTYKKVGEWQSGDDQHVQLDVQKIRKSFRTRKGEKPVSVCSEDCPRGHYRAYQDQACCFVCVACDISTSIHNLTHCEECPPGQVPEETLSHCVNITPIYMQWNTTWALIPAAFSLLGLCSTLFVFVVFLKFSSTPVIMASGRELCYCMLLGIALCYFLTFLLVSQPTSFTCAAARVIMGLSMSAIYAAIITKTNRLARVFKPSGAQRPRFITPKAQVAICMGIVSIQLIVIAIWLILDQPDATPIYPSRTEAVLTCKATTSHLLISLTYNLFLIVACTIYAFKTRKIPENFNETRHIGFTMYSTCILWLSFGPIYFATQNNFRMYIVLFQPYKNVRTRQSAVGRLVNQQMRFMSQLTYNPDSCSGGSYQPFAGNNCKSASEEASVSQASALLQTAYIEKLVQNKTAVIEKKNSLQEKKVSSVNVEIRRRRPSTVHMAGPEAAALLARHKKEDDEKKMRETQPQPIHVEENEKETSAHATLIPLSSDNSIVPIQLLLEEIAGDNNATFL